MENKLFKKKREKKEINAKYIEFRGYIINNYQMIKYVWNYDKNQIGLFFFFDFDEKKKITSCSFACVGEISKAVFEEWGFELTNKIKDERFKQVYQYDCKLKTQEEN